MEIIHDKKSIGIRAGNCGIGIIRFPWLQIFGTEKKWEVSFWVWLFCPPRLMFDTISFKTYAQIRFMWFVLQVTNKTEKI